MKHLLIYILLLFLFSCTDKTQDIEDIKTCYNTYNEALKNADGNKAVENVDKNTLAYYDKVLKKAISADSIEIMNMPTIDKITVLSIRQSISKDNILSFTAKDLFVNAINEKILAKNSTDELVISKVLVKSISANTEMLFQGEKLPFTFRFNKEDNAWKFDVTSLFDFAESGFKQAVASSGMTENELIIMAIEESSIDNPKNDLWNPLQ